MAGVEVERRSNSSSNGTSTSPTTALLEAVHFNYPWIIVAVFLVAFLANSILTAETSNTSNAPTVTGPGGKPLPGSAKKAKEEREKRKSEDFSPARKFVFIYLSVGVIITFIGNAINIVIHALSERENGWWCGEATAVSGN